MCDIVADVVSDFFEVTGSIVGKRPYSTEIKLFYNLLYSGSPLINYNRNDVSRSYCTVLIPSHCCSGWELREIRISQGVYESNWNWDDILFYFGCVELKRNRVTSNYITGSSSSLYHYYRELAFMDNIEMNISVLYWLDDYYDDLSESERIKWDVWLDWVSDICEIEKIKKKYRHIRDDYYIR